MTTLHESEEKIERINKKFYETLKKMKDITDNFIDQFISKIEESKSNSSD
jgi:predicted transcriptional regulator